MLNLYGIVSMEQVLSKTEITGILQYNLRVEKLSNMIALLQLPKDI